MSKEVKETKSEERTMKIKFYSKDFKSEVKSLTFQHVPAASLEEAYKRISDQSAILKALNEVIASEELSAAKKSAGIEGYNKNVVLDAIKAFREPLMKDGKLVEKGDEGWKELYNAQTDQLIDQIKMIPFIVASIAKKSAEAVETSSEEES